MGRFRADEIENYGSSNSSSFFQLKQNREVARVRFMYNDLDDVEGYAVHEVEINGSRKYVSCLRNYNDPIDVCPFCKNHQPVMAKLFIPVYNETQGRVQIWERGKKFYQTLSSALSRGVPNGVPIVSQLFEIERQGEPKDTRTTYGIFPVGQADNTRLEDLPEKPEVLGRSVLDKSAEELDYFIHNGRFADSGSAPMRRGSDYQSQQRNEVPIRRTPSRREDVY